MKLKTGTSFELYMTDFVNLAVIHQTTGLSPPEALKKEKPEAEKNTMKMLPTQITQLCRVQFIFGEIKSRYNPEILDAYKTKRERIEPENARAGKD